jgi:hypothetical protein
MVDMAKFPFIARRGGSQSLYYKRPVPKELHAGGRPKQVWRSLKTPDRKKAEKAYAAQHAEIELLFEQWRTEDQPSAVTSDNSVGIPSISELPVQPLTPALLRRLTDSHYQNVFEADFKERGELWEAVEKDEEAFWRGDIVAHPKNDWQRLRGQDFSYYAHLMEDPHLETVFLYCVFAKGQNRLLELKRRYDLGATGEHMTVAQTLLHSHGIKLSDGDARKLVRSLMQTELAALEDISARDQTKFDDIVDHQVNETSPAHSPPAAAAPSAELSPNVGDGLIGQAAAVAG